MPVLSASLSRPRFSGSVKILNALGWPICERPDTLIRDHFIPRYDEQGRPIHEKILGQLIKKDKPCHVFLTGKGGSGKSLIACRVAHELEQQGVPVICNNGFMDEEREKKIRQFTERHHTKNRMVLILEEGNVMLGHPDRDKFLNFLEEQTNQHANLALLLVGESTSKNLASKNKYIEHLFPSDCPERHLFLPDKVTLTELMEMIQGGLTSAGFGGLDKALSQKLQILYKNEPLPIDPIRGVFFHLAQGFEKWTETHFPNRVDSEHLEVIPAELIEQAFEQAIKPPTASE